MPVSKSEYQRIVEAQSSGTLTIYIDTSGFRKLLVDKINPQKLSAAIREPVESRVQLIRILTYLDAIAPLLASILSLFAFGWLGILGSLFAFALWASHKMHASRGAQHILPVTVVVIVCITTVFILPLASGVAKAFIMSLGLIVFMGRLLYFMTSRLVFDLIHSNYEFFNMFYLQPESAIVPLIWTSEWNESQRVVGDNTRNDITAEWSVPGDLE